MRTLPSLTTVGLVVLGTLAGGTPGEAHKPITSPYTFTEHVLPILRDHCGRCHTTDGAAPMSLLTYEETVPWAESIRIELIAGHMPPWRVEGAASRIRNVNQLSASELNVLMTWAAGGTPRGAEATPPPATAPNRAWRLGTPDLTLQPSTAFALPVDIQERTEEFTVPTGTREPRWVRAVDLMPGAPAVVRAATVSIKAASTAGQASTASSERLLALWLPGDEPVPLDAGAGFFLPAGAELTLRIHYRKTWQNERAVVADQSTVALYFAAEPAAAVQALVIAPGDPAAAADASDGRLSFRHVLESDVAVMAVYPNTGIGGAQTTVHALRPDGSREELIAFRAQPDWTRRYWLRQPLTLPRGTRIEVVVDTDDDPALLPPGAVPRPKATPTGISLTLNWVAQLPNAPRQ